ncbi:MAG TPA: NAD(P)-dependent oxidoreductase [Cryomorphaceae bacterium]|nr:NAD(P)-dependent oxidoreductase [Owenweeksia sp.]HAD96493.1 NAD(P)-dependent oxidoreductase [Cryomorphaceae bacterium]HCQ14891.1 NAD(P)-dependent oxidoreductase [Cryomorphaceae bacterium]
MKILVTGSNGLLGQKLVNKLKVDPEVELIATARGANRLQEQFGYTYAAMDITSYREVMQVMDQHQPDVVINTAAMTNVDACETEPDKCDELNIEAVKYLLEACEKHNSHLVHLSTDFIFNGKEGPYDEEAVPDPLSHYGASKLTAEKLVSGSPVSWSIIRTVLVYGVAEEMSRSNIVLWAKGALEKEQQIRVVDDQFRSPTLAEDLADGCILAAKKKAQGIYNISGKDQMSILDLVWKVADFWKLDKSVITAVKSSTLSQPAKRPPITGFILDKAITELGYTPHSFEEGLKIVDDQLNG